MRSLRIRLRPLAAFGTPLVGDTLFGQLCWAACERFGHGRLAGLLDGYTEGAPWAVLSDAFPAGYLPRPTVAEASIGVTSDPAKRKQARERRWLPAEGYAAPLGTWIDRAEQVQVERADIVTQNTIHRLTGTTGRGMFAPRQVDRIVFEPGTQLDIYCVLDESRASKEDLLLLIADIGDAGYGRDASTGLGKFALEGVTEVPWHGVRTATVMTLAPCAPAPGEFVPEASFYLPLTRFGRHGGVAARMGNPYKQPILLCRTGALLARERPAECAFVGTGLGGEARPISLAVPATVHQGYAPAVPLNAGMHR